MVLIVQALVQLGVKSKPAIPQLAGILEGTPDEDRAMAILGVLLVSGSSAVLAIEGVLRCLMCGSEETAEIAERVLWNCGPEIVPALHRAREGSTGWARERIEGVLAGFGSPQRGRFWRFERFDNDKALRVVAFVVDAMKGGPIGMKRLEEMARKQQGRELPLRFPCAESALRKHIENAEAVFGDLIIRDVEKRTVAGPTPAARRLVREIRAYLRWKSGAPAPVPPADLDTHID